MILILFAEGASLSQITVLAEQISHLYWVSKPYFCTALKVVALKAWNLTIPNANTDSLQQRT